MITWPKWWKGAGKHFLEGFPFWGTQNKIIDEVKNSLSSRDYPSCSIEWKKEGFNSDDCMEISRRCLKCISDLVAWPNSYYMPHDKVALLFGLIPGVAYEPEDVIDSIISEFDLELTDELTDIMLEGDFIEFINLVKDSPLQGEVDSL
jgi:hypothetical protein